MDNNQINNLISPMLINPNPPDNYQYVASVPDGGGTDEYFHWSINVTQDYLNWYVSASKQFAQHIFTENTTSHLRWSYYLYGEWDNGTTVDPLGAYDGVIGGTHEGVDVRHTASGRPVKSASQGKVINVSPNNGGTVQILDDLGSVVTYMHIGTPNVVVNEPVYTFTTLGSQSTSYGHSHIQVKSDSSIPSGQDDNLECLPPYSYMTWYI